MAASSRGAASSGVDYSINPPSVAGLDLLITIPPEPFRLGYVIQNQDTSDIIVVLDREAGDATPSHVVLSAAQGTGGAGGAVDMAGMPHSGRIRVYGSSTSLQIVARAW